MSLRYGSVCSGIEAATVAWHRLGWKPAWFAEIEKFPSAVLAHHYPAVPNLGDMTALPKAVLLGQAEAPDVLVGGTPCQAFSVAGMREGLNDPRGQLTIKFVELADAIDHVRLARGDAPAVVVWENVPGVLSDKGNAFGCFLGALAGEDCELVATGGKWPNAGFVSGPKRDIAWRVLDAQYFGVAQRRRRVFVVASARDGFHPAQVLFEWDGVRRDTPPSRESREGTTGRTGQGFASSGVGYWREGVGPLRAREQDSHENLAIAFGGNNTSGPIDVATARNACSTASGRMDFETETFLVQQPPVCVTGDITHTLKAEGFDASEDGTGRGQPIVAFNPNQEGMGLSSEFSPPIGASTGGGNQNCVAAPTSFPANLSGTQCASAEDLAPAMGAKNPTAVAWSIMPQNSGKDYKARQVEVLQPLMAGGQSHGNQGGDIIQTAMQVRRLTPVECERLQGFPDSYTMIPWRNKPVKECPDGPRYKALGNSMAVPCMAWIGRRIDVRLRACTGSIFKPGGLNG